jgi:hypothetical protein
MGMYDESGDELFGLLIELRRLDPNLHAEMKGLARLAVTAHRQPRDLLPAPMEIAGNDEKIDVHKTAEIVAFSAGKKRGVA